MFCSNCGKFFEGNSELCPDCENANANVNDFTTSVQDADASAFESVESAFVTEVKANEKKINTLGIVSFVSGLLGFCCNCFSFIGGIASIVTGIMCLVNLKKVPEVDTSTLSEEELAAYEAAQKTIKRSKIFSIVGIALTLVGVVCFVFTLIACIATGVLEELMYY